MRAALLVFVCALTACAVGPDYRTPQTVTPDEWQSLPQTGVRLESPDAPSLAAWWKALNDPTLNELIERALAENKTMKQALARVFEARARRGVSTADLFPAIGASAGASRTGSESRFGSVDSDPADPDLSSGQDEIYSTGLDSLWELDLFGGKRRAVEASTAQLGATEADLRDVLVTLLGDVALGYTNVRTAQSRSASPNGISRPRAMCSISRAGAPRQAS